MHKVMEPFTFHNKSTGMTNTISTTKLIQAVFISFIMCLMLSGCSNADKYVEIILVDTAPSPVCTPVPEGDSPSSADVSAMPSSDSIPSAKPEKSDKQQASVKDKQTKASHAPSSDAIPTPTTIPANESSSLAWPDASPSPIPTAPPSVTSTPAALPTPTPAATVPPVPKATPKLVSKNNDIPSRPQDIVPKSPAESVTASVYSVIDGSSLHQLQVAYDTYVSRYITAYANFETLCNPVIEFIKLMGEPTDDPDYIAELDRLKGMLYEYAEQFYQDVCVLYNEYVAEINAILASHGLQIG